MDKSDAKKKSKVIMDVDLNDPKGKQAALANTIAGIEKQFGKGSIMKLGDSMIKNIPVSTTGILSLDLALGVGGIPKGRIVEIYGPEASGKTTLALHMVAEVQKAGGIAGYIDAEHALDPVYAKNLGVNINELYISQPDDGEQALEICEAMVRSSAIDIIVIDSVAALVPKAEIEGDMGSSHVGVQARLMSQALRKLTGIINKTSCIVVFINQLREKIGISYGNPETTTGGRALKFYASIRIDVRKGEAIKNGTDIVGNKTTAKIVKNKVAPPFKSCVFDIVYGEGVSKIGDILDIAAELNIVNKSGAWFSYKETRLGQGRENTKAFLADNPDILNEIDDALRKYYNIDKNDSAGAEQAEADKNDTDQSASKSKKSKKGKQKDEEAPLLFDPGLIADEADEIELAYDEDNLDFDDEFDEN